MKSNTEIAAILEAVESLRTDPDDLNAEYDRALLDVANYLIGVDATSLDELLNAGFDQ